MKMEKNRYVRLSWYIGLFLVGPIAALVLHITLGRYIEHISALAPLIAWLSVGVIQALFRRKGLL
jgi:hypothetical protein